MTQPRFPNESPEYRQARDALLEVEIDLRTRIERVAALRRELPLGGAVREDYAFDEIDDGQPRSVRLSQLFEGSKKSLFLYSFMYGPEMEKACPICSSFLDGLDANARHITRHINVAVVARSPIGRIAEFAKARGWRNLRLLSSAGSAYNVDYLSENPDGGQMPMANVFVRRDGKVHHSWGTEMLYAELDGDPRHMDLMWPLWNVLDTTPDGRGEGYPPLDA